MNEFRIERCSKELFLAALQLSHMSTIFPSKAEEPAPEAGVPKISGAAAVQQVRRLCNNGHRCTWEILQRWRAGGAVRQQLVQAWINNPDVTQLTVNIMMEDSLALLGPEPICMRVDMSHILSVRSV